MTGVLLRLFGNCYCHLCDELRHALEPWRQRYGFEVVFVDIEGDAALERRFGERIPVLMLGDREICHYFLDETALAAALEITRPSQALDR